MQCACAGSSIWELARSAHPQAPLQASLVKICVLASPPGKRGICLLEACLPVAGTWWFGSCYCLMAHRQLLRRRSAGMSAAQSFGWASETSTCTGGARLARRAGLSWWSRGGALRSLARSLRTAPGPGVTCTPGFCLQRAGGFVADTDWCVARSRSSGEGGAMGRSRWGCMWPAWRRRDGGRSVGRGSRLCGRLCQEEGAFTNARLTEVGSGGGRGQVVPNLARCEAAARRGAPCACLLRNVDAGSFRRAAQVELQLGDCSAPQACRAFSV